MPTPEIKVVPATQILETTTPAEAARDIVVPLLQAAIVERGKATLLVSGGSSPKALFGLLSAAPLDWSRVSIGLVDERIDPAQRNADLIASDLMVGEAAVATFVPMLKPTERKDSKTPNIAAYRDILPADVTIMGMGTDGHTASWFPGSVDLQKAIDGRTNKLIPIVGVNTEGCPGNSGCDLRLTLTHNAVMQSRAIVLYIPGKDKREVFIGDRNKQASTKETAKGAPARDYPVDLLRASPALTVIMDPA